MLILCCFRRFGVDDPELQAAIAASMESEDPEVLRAIQMSMAESKRPSVGSASSGTPRVGRDAFRDDLGTVPVKDMRRELEIAGVKVVPGTERIELMRLVRENREKRRIENARNTGGGSGQLPPRRQAMPEPPQPQRGQYGIEPSVEEDEMLARALQESLNDHMEDE